MDKELLLQTERLLLRAFRLEDLDELQDILGDAQVMEYVEPPFDRAKTEAFLRDFCIGKRGALAAERKADGKLIGYLLFKPYGEPEVYEMGWIFNRSVWRQGYAAEICAALRDYAFQMLHVRKLFAETADPVRSAGLMRKLGMAREESDSADGLLLYGLTREDWERRA